MSSSIRQGFTFPRADIQRAKTAADVVGVSMNEWMRRAVRAALDGPGPATQASVGAALDPALLDRLAALIAKGEADTTASAGAVEELRKTGMAFRGLLDRMAASTAMPAAAPARPAAPAPARPAPRTDGLDEVRLSSGAR